MPSFTEIKYLVNVCLILYMYEWIFNHSVYIISSSSYDVSFGGERYQCDGRDIVDDIQTIYEHYSCFFQGPNRARGGIATESSIYSLGKPQNAIDGNRASNWNQRSITHTQYSYRPWWRVDLRTVYKVTYVKITNRKDCCANRINGAEIRIGNSLSDNGNRNKLYVHFNFNVAI